jgi:hypothetical protein
LNEAEFAACARSPAAPKATEFLEKILNDYEAFVHAIWINRKLDRVSVLDDVARDMCRWAANGPRRRGVLAFRGEGKTHKVSACLTCYRLRRDAQRKIFIIGKSKGEAKKTLALVKGWLSKIWFLEDLKPHQNEKWRRDNTEQLDVGPATEHRQPSVTAIGIDGNIEGNRAHTIIPDDIETKKNSKTQEARAELLRLCNEFVNVLYPETDTIDPVEIVCAGTPKNEETLYVKMIDQGYSFRSYPIVYPSPAERVINLAPFLQDRLDRGLAQPGQPTCPKRFGELEISVRRSSGFIEWCMEYMLIADLAKSNRYPLRLKDLIVMPVHRDHAPLSVQWGTKDHNGDTALPIRSLGFGEDRCYGPMWFDQQRAPFDGITYAALDPAGKGLDKSGLAIGATLASMIWVKGVFGLDGGADTSALDRIATILREHDARDLWVEINIDAFGLYEQFLYAAIRRHAVEPAADSRFPKGWTCSLTTGRSQGQKEVRIISVLEPIISGHRMVIAPEAIELSGDDETANELQYQITRINRNRNALTEDGKLDALSMLCKRLQSGVTTEPAHAAETRRARQLQDAIAEQRRLCGLDDTTDRVFTHR